MSKIAVLCPSYNQAKYLPSLFESLLDQDYPDNKLSIYISNDASTDNTSEIIRSYSTKLSSRYEVTTSNYLFNLGGQGREHIKKLSGAIPDDCDYVSIIEGDDYILDRSRYTKQINFLNENPSFGAVHSDVSALYETGEVCTAFWKKYRKTQTGNDPNIPQGNILGHLFKCNFIYTCSLLIKKDLYKRAFNYDLFTRLGIYLGDYAGVLRLAKITNIGYIDEPLAMYRVLSNSSSHKNRDLVVGDTVKIQKLAISGELFDGL